MGFAVQLDVDAARVVEEELFHLLVNLLGGQNADCFDDLLTLVKLEVILLDVGPVVICFLH